MKNTFISMSIAAAMEAMQYMPPELKTVSHKLSGNIKGYLKTKSTGRRWRSKSVSKYKPHQGKQECARRLRRGSAAWYGG